MGGVIQQDWVEGRPVSCRCYYCATWKERCVFIDTSDGKYRSHVICVECLQQVLASPVLVLLPHPSAPVGRREVRLRWWYDPAVLTPPVEAQ